MKIVRYFSFFFVTILILPIIYFSFFFDSKSFKNSIVDNISKKISGDVRFDNKIDLTFFPYPKLILNNLSFFNNNLSVKVANTQITSKWISILQGDLKFKNVKFLNPIIFFDLKKVDQSKIHNNYFLHASIENNFKFFDQYIKIFEKIEIQNGVVKILTNSRQQNLEKVNFLFTNSIQQINGNFFLKNFNSNFSLEATSQSQNYEEISISIEQNILNQKEKIFLNGVLLIKEKKFEFNGLLKSKNLNISKLIQNNKHKSKEKDFLKKVKYSFSDFFKINIDAKIEKLKISNQTFKNVTFNSYISNNFMRIEQFNCSYLGGVLKLNAEYTKSDNRLKGVLFLNDFSLPSDLFEERKYFISGGKSSLSSSFESTFLKNDFQSLMSNLNLVGKLEIENADLNGINLVEISKQIDNFTGINDIFKIFELSKNNKKSNIDSIKSDFKIDNNELKFDNLTLKSSHITVYSAGKYFLHNKEFDVSNEIKIKSKKFPNFPSFNINIKGLSSDLNYIYDFKNLKEYLISKSLKKLLKKNNEKLENFETFLEFFID